MPFRKLLLLLSILLFPASEFHAQSCLTGEDVASLLNRVQTGAAVAANKKLSAELLKISARSQDGLLEVVRADEKKKPALRNKLRVVNDESAKRLCDILKEFGWPTSDLVGTEGVNAAFQILKNSATYETQRDLLPVIIAATKKENSQRPQLAGLIDRLRVSAGMKQLFGTQAVVVNGFLVIYPIEDEKHVDNRRQQFGLVTMAEHLRSLEHRYQTPVVRSRDLPSSQLSADLQRSLSTALDANQLDTNTNTISDDDVIRTDISLVNLNVSVFNKKLKSYVGELSEGDFKVLEDGAEQTITFFASTARPFDLVLLIDLSGSTSSKRDLIRTSTQRFIEAARPSDRIAIVTFATTPTLVAPLTSDRTKLLDAAKEISGSGGSNIWDALKYTLDEVVGPPAPDRRRAVVMMTDGADSSMGVYGRPDFGSHISFADLLEAVQHNDTLIVPIYLDTESDEYSNEWTKRMYVSARKILQTLAAESGGSYYTARKVSDLNGVYEQVINDLGKIYSLGYKPTNSKRDQSWRRVEVQVVNRPDLIPHARPGYYAK